MSCSLREIAVVVLAVALIAPAAHAQMKNDYVMVGGVKMNPGRMIMENLARSHDHGTFVQGLKHAGYENRLRTDEDIFTVFAPPNSAFDKLPPVLGDGLMKPENALRLSRIIGYHIIPGRLTMVDIAEHAKENKGSVSYKTLAGNMMTFVMNDENALVLTDDYGTVAHIVIPDIEQVNGVIHVIDTVLLPASIGY